MRGTPLLLVLLILSQAQANDTAFAGHGSTIIPIKNNDIEMIQEHVILNGGVFDGSLQTWEVSCRFVFKNTSKKSVSIKMGFPFPRIPDGDSTRPPGRTRTRTGIYDFKVLVGGNLIDPNYEKLDKSKTGYAEAYIWPVIFGPGERLEVINTYLTSISHRVGGVMWADYVLMTGSNWKGGRIGRSLLEVKPNILIESCEEEIDKTDKTSPPGMKIVGKGKARKLVWDLKNFRPEQDLHVCFRSERSHFAELIGVGVHEGESLHKLRIKRNSIYARHGYIFKNRRLRTYFKRKWWYNPDPQFSVNRLTKEEQEFVQKVKELEKKKKSSLE